MATKPAYKRVEQQRRQMRQCQIVALCANPVAFRCEQCGRRFCEAHQYAVVKTPYPCCPVCKHAAKAI